MFSIGETLFAYSKTFSFAEEFWKRLRRVFTIFNISEKKE